MKKLGLFSVLLIITLLPADFLLSQVPEWPPGGVKKYPPSPVLPGGRFVPITNRYNLVWADQIIPGQTTPRRIEFAAKNYAGTQKLWADQVSQFRQYNSNFLCLIYHLAVGINPQHNDDCPDPKSESGSGFIGVVAPAGYVSEWDTYFLPWLSDNGITQGSARYENMFQHYDESNESHRVWHQDPYWLMNISNDDWTQYITDQCIGWMDGNDNEGCFFDVSVETDSYLYNPKESNPAPGNFNWWEPPHEPFGTGGAILDRNDFSDWMNGLYKAYYQKIYQRFHTAVLDYLVIPNVDQMVTSVYDPTWLDGGEGETVDGVMMENFGDYTGQDMYLTLERAVRHITGRNKILIAQFDADTPEERYRRAAMYMLIKNNISYININPGIIAWYPEYEINLGVFVSNPADLEELRVDAGGHGDWHSLWERYYEQGVVVCNTSDEAIEYMPNPDLPTGVASDVHYKMIVTEGGGEVSEDGIPPAYSVTEKDVSVPISIEPSQCMIIRFYITGVEDDKSNYEPLVYPNPANGVINIKTDGLRSASICDIFGRELYSSDKPADSGIITINTSAFNPGTYFLKINTYGGTLIKKIVIRR